MRVLYGDAMILVPIGLQCSVPEGIKRAGLRTCSYPFDWLWSPAKTSLAVLELLVRDGVEAAAAYMTSGHVKCRYWGNERYTTDDASNGSYTNVETGLGVTHFTIDDAFGEMLRRRLARLLDAIIGDQPVALVYADAACTDRNYYLDDVEYGVDATDALLAVRTLLLPLNPRIEVVYFCWDSRASASPSTVDAVKRVPFSQQRSWSAVSDIIAEELRTCVPQPLKSPE